MKTKHMSFNEQKKLLTSILQENKEYCKCEVEKNVFGFNNRLICGVCLKPLGIISK